jgi:four helix bundle protein
MRRHSYKNLEVYKRSLALSVKILSFIDEVRPYRLAEDLMSSSISVPSNIAEGSQRGSDKEFARFLEYSAGSSAEQATQLTALLLANKLKHIPLQEYINEAEEINRMLHGLIDSLGKSN